MADEKPSGAPKNEQAGAMRNVLVVAECENKEKLLNEVRAYQRLVVGGTASSSGGSAPDDIEVKDGPERTLTFHSDEPPHLLGEGKHPQPLSYIAGGIGTWLLSNLKLYASRMRLTLRAARVRVEMDCFQGGSVLRGTVVSGCREVRSFFELESDEPEEKLRLLIRNAKRGCFAENLVQTAVPLRSSIRLNGKEIEVSLAD